MRALVNAVVASIVCLFIASGCSSTGAPPTPETAEQLTAEGWGAYIAGQYRTAVNKFNQAIATKGTYVDAYNGAGWSYAKLNVLDTAVIRFNNGLGRDTANNEVRAGLAFVDNALKLYAGSSTLATAVLQANASWVFSRDHSVAAQDLHLLIAENDFAVGNYAQSLAEVQLLNGSFNADVSTVAGQLALAKEIERLRPLV